MAVGFALVCVLYSATYYSGAFDSWYLPFSGSASVSANRYFAEAKNDY